MPAIKLSDDEVEGRRRLLLEFIRRLRTENEARQFIESVRLLVEVPDELEAQAIGAFHDAREAEEADAETRRTEDDTRVTEATGGRSEDNGRSGRPKAVNPYAKPPPPTAYQKLMQPAPPKATATSNKKSGAGRPQGAKNQKGHKAGGDRKSERFKLANRPLDKNQGTLDSIVRKSAADGDDGDDDSSTNSSSSDDSSEAGGSGEGDASPTDDYERRRKAREKRDEVQAFDALEKYATSFPNGTIEEKIPDDEDEEKDDDDGDSEDEDDRSYSKRKCYPATGSPVHRYLAGIHTKVQRNLDSPPELLGNHNSINIRDTIWVAPTGNPVADSFGATAKPDSFYTAGVFVFMWDPMLQYPNHMPSKATCPKCGQNNTKCDGGWNFRPFHWFDRIVYVYHRYIACNGCGARCPTVRADFISCLPTLVAEQFPFTLPSERGPGLYDPMISMMKLLFTDGVMWGKFAKVINSLQSSNFARAHVAYLDSVDFWLNVQRSAIVESRVPVPFSPQTSQDGYCGIKLLPSLLKKGFRAMMAAMEPYMQASFQTANDVGLSSDDSFKAPKYIHATIPGGKKVQPFTCASTAISLGGKVCYSRFTPNKSMDVLQNVIKAYGQVRKHAGQEDLLRMEVDNGAHDVAAHISNSPSLLNGVVPFQEKSDLPRITLGTGDYVYIVSRTAASDYALSVQSHVDKVIKEKGQCRIAVDTEYDASQMHVVAIVIEGHRPAALVHPYDWGSTFEPNMKKLLELDDVLIIGCHVTVDVHKLRGRFGIRIKRVRDIRRYCLHDDPNQLTGLKDLSANYCGIYLDKSCQLSNWSIPPPLPKFMQDYVMGDAFLPLNIDSNLTEKFVNSGITSARYPPNLRPGTRVIIKIGGKAAAKASIVSIGDHSGRDGGESRMWGSLYIGAKKATVELISIILPGVKVPFQHDDWGRDKITLGEAFNISKDRVLAVHTGQIHALCLPDRVNQPSASTSAATSPSTSNEPGSLPADTHTTRVAESNKQGRAATSPSTSNEPGSLPADTNSTRVAESNEQGRDEPEGAEKPSPSQQPDADKTVEVVNVESDEENVEAEDDDAIRSRVKSDQWHEFDTLRSILGKNSAVLPAMTHLCRVATTAINKKEEDAVVAVLKEKGVDDPLEHFIYNREYHLTRVRCPPRKGAEASHYLLEALSYIRENEHLKEYVTTGLVKFFEGWALRCRLGRYEDLPDVEMYSHNGYDSNNLPLWHRRRGSKAENFHQKMHAAAGPFGFGMETGHCLHVLLAYMYNVSAGINRCGEPDFGHADLWYEDRIQSRILEIYGVQLFPNRTNVSEFKWLDFVAVGIGPLHFDDRFVTTGPPADNLKGDLKWAAERMGLKYPVLPPCSKKELGMIKRFCSEHPGQKTKDIEELCMKFKQNANGKDIFPKIPSQIRPFIKKWKLNQETNLLLLQLGKSYKELYDKMRSDTVDLPAPAQKQQSKKSKKSKQSSTAATTLPLKDPPHVPPPSAPGQKQYVESSSEKLNKRCAWWPACDKDVTVCGGSSKKTCNIYGTNGSQCRNAPTDEDLRRQVRYKTWAPATLKWLCPWGCGKAVDCGGRRRDLCEKYGNDGTHIGTKPSKEELKQIQNERARKRMAERRAAAKRNP